MLQGRNEQADGDTFRQSRLLPWLRSVRLVSLMHANEPTPTTHIMLASTFMERRQMLSRQTGRSVTQTDRIVKYQTWGEVRL